MQNPNDKRRERARKALDAYKRSIRDPNAEDSQIIGDMIADICHLVGPDTVDNAIAVGMDHFEHERAEGAEA